MRRKLFWLGWVILCALPIAVGVEIFLRQDIPPLNTWRLALVAGGIILVIFARNRDEVLKHKLL